MLRILFSHPKDYSIDKLNIIEKWRAQGFLSESWVTSDEDLVTVGDVYFNNLVMHSFFQKGIKYLGRKFEYYEMHDLVHDFAKSIAGNECFTLTTKDTNAQESDFSRARHLSLLMEEISAVPSFIYKATYLHTLNIYGHIPLVSSELFCHLTCLRTLDLGGTYLEELPNEIEKLIHLRFLNLAEARFKELPKTVTTLFNLQVLDLFGCRNLCKIPEEIGKLVNLIDLDMTSCGQLSDLPEGIGRLSKLRGLSDFIIGGEERGGCKLGELKDLNFLKGSLRIIGLRRVENENEAKMACLKNKQHLCALYFYFNQYTGISRVDDGEDDEGEDEEEEVVDEEGKTKEEKGQEVDGGDALSRRMEDVLESLQPYPNLEKLIIDEYPGVVFPNWMCSKKDFMILSNLVFLELDGCRKCKQLPPTLGKLPSLETLVIHGMDQVKLMGVEFFAIDGATTKGDSRVDKIFPKLKVFQLSEMWNLEKWDMRVKENDRKEFIFMPCLRYLALIELPKLRRFPQHLTLATSLRKLMIWKCPKVTWMPSPFPNIPFLQQVEELILKKDAGSFSKSLVPNNHQMFLPKLKLLRVRQSPYSSLPEGLGKLTSLEILDIRTCPKIKSIPDGELQYLTALQELTIMRCPTLEQDITHPKHLY